MARIPSSRFSDPFAPDYSISAQGKPQWRPRRTVFNMGSRGILVLSGGYEFSGIVPEKGFALILSF